jgi:hypothetical protein
MHVVKFTVTFRNQKKKTKQKNQQTNINKNMLIADSVCLSLSIRNNGNEQDLSHPISPDSEISEIIKFIMHKTLDTFYSILD